MDAVRRGAGGFVRYFLPVLLLAVVVQVILVGWGAFGIEEGSGFGEGDTLDLHRGLGHIFGTFGSVLLLIGSLLFWPRDKRLLGWLIAAAVLLFIQPIIAVIGAGEDNTGGQFVGALHALNALVLLGLLGSLTMRMWRRRDPMADELAEPV